MFDVPPEIIQNEQYLLIYWLTNTLINLVLNHIQKKSQISNNTSDVYVVVCKY